jgi:signal transduction histidine kinase
MRRSFRLRLALSTALLAGIALAGFSSIAWWQLRHVKIEALDRELRDHAERELSHPRPFEHWSHYEQQLKHIFATSNQQQTLLLLQINGEVVYQSKHWPMSLLPDTLPWAKSQDLSQQLAFMPYYDIAPPPRPAVISLSIAIGSQQWRFGLASLPLGEKLAIGVNLAVLDAEMAQLRNAFLLATPLALGLIGFGAWFVSGRALSPIEQLSKTMATLNAKGLDQRIALDNKDYEFEQLICVFNTMLERLERSFLQASRFSADAAHELKTPLAILQGQLEQALNVCETESLMQTRLTDILDEVLRLGSISRKLLLLSLADAGHLRLHLTSVDISQALENLLDDALMLAPQLTITADLPKGLTAKVDAELFEQVLHNLLSNAIKYNLPNGWITISLKAYANRLEIAIANSTANAPALDAERIFERFYRVDLSHNRHIEGVGLGLSLSKELIKAHGGDLLLHSSTENAAQFIIILPLHITNL